MGDMAEDALQQGLDAWIDGDADWDYGGESGYGPRPRTCRRCHTSNLWWSVSNGNWRLIDSAGNWHVCPNPKAKDVFK